MLLPLCAVLLYVCGVVVYRLYFHPLSKFPGPKLAAASTLYEFYYNVIQGGRYLFEIEEMHRKYGPIVRITPHELHVSDPYFYTEIYAGPTRKREKDPRMVRLAGQPTSMFATVDHNLHASRRAILSSFFSKKSITGLETMIQGKVEKLMGRLATACEQGTVVPLDSASSALTADIISEFAYGVSLDYLDDPNFKNEVAESILSLASSVHVLKFFPFILSLSKIIPDSVVETLSPEASKILRLQKLVRAQAAVALKNGGHVKGKNTMFGALCDPSLPAEERTLDRLQDEGFSLIGGGTETTTGTLKIIMFNLLHNKSLLSKLREELAQNSCDTWAELEKLPYMRGVMNEGLRLSGVITRLPRRAPDEALQLNEWTIPANTLLSTSSWFMHMNTELFPDPYTFDPERWIRAQEAGQRLEPMIAAFIKGSRQCLGNNLALAELYLVISALVRRFDMDLYKTGPEHIVTYREFGFGIPKEKGGLKVIITKTLSS
ncbi:uncharacterized protein N7446_004848 [Penicillium canescens]|uniref:Cytochrome P450 n=1 Tax=Penicillium canescens TaxID=5083 RepID=A0AAD6I0I0_PENCN|nr:uncharacterized protein N7446_004848 [Penicillium canescens]KAJ6026551.1 hypothetical protein N7460_011368 [Penicillium canescens]KAJ6039835.1 hypothetical protein N7444_008740 [Penicillium canescens]KAJ6067811.1 hypothetical protein N7446_004848 [Penicillium canescens]